MNEPTLKKICEELAENLTGQKFGKIFALAKLQLAIDFRLSDGRYLFISIEPNAPRIYIIKRKFKELEQNSKLQLSFVSFLRKRLAHSVLQAIEKIENERILKFKFLAQDEFGKSQNYTLVSQFTGRSANLFLLDERDLILDSLRETFGEGQELASQYSPPIRENPKSENKEFEIFPQNNFETLSEALDDFYFKKETTNIFQSKVQAARNSINSELKKKSQLVKKLNEDLNSHGNAEHWKKFGDLILANVANAERKDNKIYVIDYFDENTPKIEIEADANLPLTEVAERFFKRYTKARNAKEEISKRLEIAEKEIEEITEKLETLENAIIKNDLETIESFVGKKKQQILRATKNETSKYYKEFISSDGYEILVGKRSKDNDYLTFRIAKSLDTWLHAADYPGSHVVIRNPNRQEIPYRTLLEAAQLAAFYSKAKNESKVGVHYTQKKFVNKPKGAAAGLVSLASFKTLLVEPKVLEQK